MKNTSDQNKSKKRFLCKLGFHKYENIRLQVSKGIYFGHALGYRVTQKCKFCDDINYIRLNMCMPIKYLYEEWVWKNL